MSNNVEEREKKRKRETRQYEQVSELCKNYLKKIDDLNTTSFNRDQKELAKKILISSDDNDLENIYKLISKRIKTGFVFDSAPATNDKSVAILKENKELSLLDLNKDQKQYDENGITNDNLLIIGENYDALKNLLLVYKNKIDIIYIDPPYNTDASIKEKNNFSEDEISGKSSTKFVYRDKFSRAGWLNLMQDRLYMARELLTDDGVIFVSIDDAEQAYLKVLMDEIFGEENFVTNFVWQKKSGGGQAKYIYEGHEYICFYAKDKKNQIGKFGILTNRENKEIKKDENGNNYYLETDIIRKEFGKKSKDTNHRNCFYEELKDWKDQESIDDIEQKLKIKEYELVWYEKLKMNFIAKRMYLINNKYIWTIPYSLIQGHWTSDGNNELENILNGHFFDNPKPISLIKTFLNMNKKSDNLILDFFAGSGTTGQAVMELNQEDGGNRKFILVTNNEEIKDNKGIGTGKFIAHDVTYERLHRITKGTGTKGQTDFEWIKKNKPYQTNNLRVFDIDYYDISINKELEPIIEQTCSSMRLLDKNFSCNDKDVLYKLFSLKPLEKGDKND